MNLSIASVPRLRLTPPMTKNVYDGLSYPIKVASKQVTEKSMSDAAARRGTEQTANVEVSEDGTWQHGAIIRTIRIIVRIIVPWRQRKNLSSRYGVVTAIFVNNGKVLDVSVFSKLYKGCTSMKKIASADPIRYETWKLSHNCKLNCTGSSTGMEIAGATKIFSSSKEKHGLHCTSFYGDGDSKAYPAVKDIFGPSKSIKLYVRM